MFSNKINKFVANNRKQRRVIRNDITIVVVGEVGKRSYPFFVEPLNISLQGMAFRCNKALRVSNPLNLSFSFSDDRNFFMKSTVIHKMQETASDQSGIQRAFKKMFESDSTFFQYGIKFEKVNDNFQTTFIKTMLDNKGYAKNQYQVASF